MYSLPLHAAKPRLRPPATGSWANSLCCMQQCLIVALQLMTWRLMVLCFAATPCERFAAGPGLPPCKVNEMKWCQTDLAANAYSWPRFMRDDMRFGILERGHGANHDGIMAELVHKRGWKVCGLCIVMVWRTYDLKRRLCLPTWEWKEMPARHALDSCLKCDATLVHHIGRYSGWDLGHFACQSVHILFNMNTQ